MTIERATRGVRIRLERQKMGLTQAQLAQLCGVNVSFVGLMETDRNAPGRQVLFRLADALHVSPQFIENGELTPEDQAKKARHVLWPEIVYFIANHLIVPRELEPNNVTPDNDGLRAAIDRAYDAPHFCEYRAWTESAKGRALAKDFEGSWGLEELIERTAGKDTRNLAPLWIDLAGSLDTHRRTAPWHYSAVSDHPHVGHPADCFAFDVETSYKLYPELPFLWGYPGLYEREPYRDHVVAAAFPPIFWSAAKRWGDRRLAGWFWYLDVPVDLFGPLARLARQYGSAEEFTTNARRLLDQATVEDRDVFLGLFPDIIGERALYIDRFGSVQCVGGVMRASHVHQAFEPIINRREAKRTSKSHELIDLMATMNDEEMLRRCEKALREIAPPVVEGPLKMMMVDTKGKRLPKPAREKDRPPETLP